MATGFTGNMKCAIYNYVAATAAGPSLGSATPIANPVSGNNTFTFSTPVAVVKGTQYHIAFIADQTTGVYAVTSGGATGWNASQSYAAFPTSSPGSTGASNAPIFTVSITLTASNNSFVNEAQQDGAATYVYDSTVGDADFYGIGSIAVTPASVVAVTTRGFLQKSDAGSRSGAVQLRSGSSTVSSGSATLSTTWAWMWRTDTVDPATGAAWTPTGVNNVNIGPTVTA